MISINLYQLEEKELGYLFYQKRTKKGLSIDEISKKIKCSKTTLSKFENGTQLMSMTKIIKYAKVIDLNLKFCIES